MSLYKKLFVLCTIFTIWIGELWAQTPLHNYVVILLDASGSMAQSDPQFLRREATKLLIRLLRHGDRVILAEFGDGVRVHTPEAITLSSETQKTLFRLVDNLSSKDKYTDILGAFEYAVSRIASLPAEARQSFAPTVILLTDGKDDIPGKGDRTALIENKIRELAQLEVKVHTIGFPGKSDMKILEKAATQTGGDLWVLHRPSDLLRGFFGLSRVMGNRWPLQEHSVHGGSVTIALPDWARRLVVCYLPNTMLSEPIKASLPATEEILANSYQILKFGNIPSNRLDLTLPAGGTILVDAEESLLIQAEKVKRAPARLPFPFRAAIIPVKGGDLGRPHFLTQTFLTLRLRHEGLPEITLPLYDDGQHDDGQSGDGRFGGFVSGLSKGRWNYQVTARTPYSPTLAVSGELEVLANPIAVSPPGRVAQFVLAPFTGRLTWKICNLTDVPLTGELILTPDKGERTSQSVKNNAKECQSFSVTLPPSRHEGLSGQATLRMSGESEPVWVGEFRVRPWWLPSAVFLGLIGLAVLSFIFPRRSSVGSTITVTATVAGQEYARILRVNRQGRVEASDLPAPINDPGIFRARSGMWRRGIIYLPAPWCQPSFPGKRPPQKGRGYLLKGPTTWRCATEHIQVEYHLSPRFR
ncbi:MAG: VWA domain-containing protein [Candidatus Methanomethylicaceae archaeon]